MCYVETMKDGRVRNSFPCRSIPEARRMAVSIRSLLAEGEYVRVVKEIDS